MARETEKLTDLLQRLFGISARIGLGLYSLAVRRECTRSSGYFLSSGSRPTEYTERKGASITK